MASLILERARAARRESEQVRVASLELRHAMRLSNRLAHAKTERAAAAAEARNTVRCAMTSASPWSGLQWRRDLDDLSRVLVPLD